MVQLDLALADIEKVKVIGFTGIGINGICYDSRKVKNQDVFIAIKGLKTDGHQFLQQAIAGGAKCIIVEDDKIISDQYCDEIGVVKVVVRNSSRAMALMANAFYGYPARDIKMIGITGTNGKTTTSYLVKSMFESAGEKTGLLGTINYIIGDKIIPASKTTPESITVFQYLDEMRSNNIRTVVMEVSSHSLAMDRVYGLGFDAASFTNLTQDHLDFHKNFEDYFNAKKILFDVNLKTTGKAVFNIDDEYGRKIAVNFKGEKFSYGFETADISGKIMDMSFDGMILKIINKKSEFLINSLLTGNFNAYNLLCAASIGLAMGLDIRPIVAGLEKVNNVSGRFQKLKSKKSYWAIVDYSHTPDSLKNALLTIRQIIEQNKKGKVITVFGCGGNRDKSKRPIMGKIASELSDRIFITTDNPRDEDPNDIIKDIMPGILKTKEINIEIDRKLAIEAALRAASTGDIVLIAGKGHEDYQEIKNIKHHFDDREIIENYFAKE